MSREVLAKEGKDGECKSSSEGLHELTLSHFLSS